METKTNSYQPPVEELAKVGDNILGSLARWVWLGIPTGSFLRGVLTNDLYMAVRHADPNSMKALPDIVRFLNHMPIASWGDRQSIESWMLYRRETINDNKSDHGMERYEWLKEWINR